MRRPFLFALLLIATFPLSAQTSDFRGLKTVVGQLEGVTATVGRQYAVLIAIDKYENWMTLQNPVKDAKEIREILSRRYYITDFLELYNEAATKAGIMKLFSTLISTVKPEDSMLIFYAGHGHLDETTNTGFWIPVDGGTDVYEQANWLPNTQVRGFIGNIKARHIALIADSCFSGDFINPTRGIAPTITNEYFKKAYSRISRQVLTSGASESVPDVSPFTRQLKLALEGNTAPYLDPLMLFNQIRLGVTQTTPLFGDLRDSGHQEGASFLFFLRQGAPEGQPSEKPIAAKPPKPKLTIEKSYGKVRIETKSAGELFLDGEPQGEVPSGGAATLEDVETGSHELEMRYDNGSTESNQVTVQRDSVASAIFLASSDRIEQQPVEPEKPQEAQPVASAEQQPPGEPLAKGDAIPTAAIKIDGKFDDWEDIRPAFVNPYTSKGNMGIRRAFLARDDKTLYVKMEIADDTPSSWFHSDNFNREHNTVYGVFIGDATFNIGLNVYYDRERNTWHTDIGGGPVRDWKHISTLGSWAMKGSSMEAGFPLAAFAKYVVPGNQYMTSVYSTYNEGGKAVAVDSTQGKQLQY
jgi:hypothetical protein